MNLADEKGSPVSKTPSVSSRADGARAPLDIDLALQGGGAHGAFTWGVLDAILEDGRIAIEALSGTSAGAMNAVVLAEGWIEVWCRPLEERRPHPNKILRYHDNHAPTSLDAAIAEPT